MRSRYVIAAALCALAPSAARADALYDSFQSLCLVTAGKSGPVKSVASAQGFITPPPDVAAGFKAPPNTSNTTTLWKVNAGKPIVLIWGDGQIPTQTPVRADFCAVATATSAGNVEQVLEQSLAVGPAQVAGPSRLFIFDDNGVARRAVSMGDPTAVAAAMTYGRLRFVGGQSQGATSAMLLLSPKAAQ